MPAPQSEIHSFLPTKSAVQRFDREAKAGKLDGLKIEVLDALRKYVREINRAAMEETAPVRIKGLMQHNIAVCNIMDDIKTIKVD